ncbi:MAG: Na/Pi symporter, partial [Desulfofustis sp.]
MNTKIYQTVACAGALLLVFPLAARAAQTDNEIAWGLLFMQLMGGLALFLSGLDQLSDGLKKVAGDALKVMLARLTTNRVSGAITGAVVTGILNSSSITTVLVVGYVTAGIMTLSQSVGVIMVANIGST